MGAVMRLTNAVVKLMDAVTRLTNTATRLANAFKKLTVAFMKLMVGFMKLMDAVTQRARGGAPGDALRRRVMRRQKRKNVGGVNRLDPVRTFVWVRATGEPWRPREQE